MTPNEIEKALTDLFGGQAKLDEVEVQGDSVYFWIRTAPSGIYWQGITLDLMEIQKDRIYFTTTAANLNTQLAFHRSIVRYAQDVKNQAPILP